MSDQQQENIAPTAPPAEPVFDSARPFVVPIQSGGRKVCKVRFPSDAEWCERVRKQPIVRHFLGRGKYETAPVHSDEVNAALFERIRIDKDSGVAFDAADAGRVLDKLSYAFVESCEREGDNFRVTLKVPGAVTVHLVRMPTARETDRYEAGSAKPIGGRRSTEVRSFLEPSGELYDALAVGAPTGYASAVPIVHKFAVVSEVVAELNAEDEEAIPEA